MQLKPQIGTVDWHRDLVSYPDYMCYNPVMLWSLCTQQVPGLAVACCYLLLGLPVAANFYMYIVVSQDVVTVAENACWHVVGSVVVVACCCWQENACWQ